MVHDCENVTIQKARHDEYQIKIISNDITKIIC